jgi:hypothetical protein
VDVKIARNEGYGKENYFIVRDKFNKTYGIPVSKKASEFVGTHYPFP